MLSICIKLYSLLSTFFLFQEIHKIFFMYLESPMTNIEWTIENEIQLLFAMINHKPIGKN